MNYLFLKIIYLFFLFSLSFSELIFLYSHMRHGTRGPGFGEENNLPTNTDIYGVEWEGNGEITKIGMRMLYLLGHLTRKRYQKFLSNIQNPLEIRIISSKKRRTVMSAQAFIQGMFPISSPEIFSDKEKEKMYPPIKIDDEDIISINNIGLFENTHIIPIHLLDKEENQLLLTDKLVCPNINSYKLKAKKDKMFNDFYIKLNNTYGQQLKKYFNQPNYEFIFNIDKVFRICDVFEADYANSKDLSSFEKEGINLQHFYNLCVEFKTLFLFNGECNEEISSIAMTKTMPKIIDWMEKRINIDRNKEMLYNKFDNPKVVVYSGHDTTLAPFELFMKKTFNTPLEYPKFGSSLFLELHRNNSGVSRGSTLKDYYIEYYLNGKFVLRQQYQDFIEKIKEQLWTQEKISVFCVKKNNTMIKYVIVAGFISLLIVLVMIWVYFHINKRKNQVKQKKYNPIRDGNDMEEKNSEELINLDKKQSD